MFTGTTTPILAYIYKNIHSKYPHIHTDIEDDFYNCIISKHEIKNREVLKFKNTRMRRVTKGEINDITFATTHLESEFGKLATKK